MNSPLYSSLKLFAYPDRLERIRQGDVPPPVHVRIKPTNVCNHSCYFCAYRNDELLLGGDMSTRDRIPREKMMEIVDDLIAMDVKAVTFSGGGEPLIYPHIAETITRLAGAGIRIGMLSNGSRLLGKPAEAMAQYGTWLRVSIDGWDGPSYSHYRDVDITEFDKVIDNLFRFSQRNSACVLGASVIIDHMNAPHLFSLCSTLRKAGVSHVKFSPCIVKNEGAENNRYHEDFAAQTREQIERCRSLEHSRFKVIDHYHRLQDMFALPYASCHMARLLTVIGADCSVYSCQDKAYTASGKLGSIQQRRFREFWESEENKAALAGLVPAHHCKHHCVAASKLEAIDDFFALSRDHIAFV